MSAPARVLDLIFQRRKSLAAIKRWDRVILALAAGAILVLSGIWLAPRLLSLVYLTRGSRALDRAVREAGLPIPPEFACDAGSIQNIQVLEDLDRTIALFQSSLRYHSTEAQAHLLLGRTYCLLGQPEKASSHYLTYTKLKPGNPLGYLELAIAQERLPDKNSSLKERLNIWKKAQVNMVDMLSAARQASRKGRFEEAMRWNARAAETYSSHPVDTFPRNLLVQNSFILESFITPNNWLPCPWCENVVGKFQTQEGILSISYLNDPSKRDHFGYVYQPEIPIVNFQEILLYIQGDPSTYIMMEIVIDNERIRPISYEKAPAEWTVLSIPIQGKILNQILLTISEPNTDTKSTSYDLDVDWILLR